MARAVQSHLSCIERLSPELRQLVLIYTTDWPSLRSAVLSCPTFYSTFKSGERWILTRFLGNVLGPDVFPEAFLAQGLRNRAISALSPESAKATEDWLATELRKTRRAPDGLVTVEDCLDIMQLHRVVGSFVDEYVEYCKHPAIYYRGPEPSTTLVNQPLTDTEKDRISRAFYLSEIVSRLHRCGAPCAQKGYVPPWDASENTVKHPLFSALSPWENEQLRCVDIFLEHFHLNKCVRHIHSVSLNGRALGARRRRRLKDALQNQTSYRLGLEGLCEASHALEEGDSTRLVEMLLQGKTMNEVYESGALDLEFRLHEALDDLQRRQDRAPGKPDELELFLRGASSLRGDDTDPGPRTAWTWVNTGIGWGRWAGRVDTEQEVRLFDARCSARNAALVMWDHSRLQASGLFSHGAGSWVLSTKELTAFVRERRRLIEQRG
ncbi:uncharacterized protein PG998_007851 [Apiospora kogelbergensis]|uniref:uncharacterized protein n=1 Tax=Apiospora kogelbergensis TaxID=1337665 RepID=UPI00312E467D